MPADIVVGNSGHTVPGTAVLHTVDQDIVAPDTVVVQGTVVDQDTVVARALGVRVEGAPRRRGGA